jgi:hypothetical protein
MASKLQIAPEALGSFTQSQATPSFIRPVSPAYKPVTSFNPSFGSSYKAPIGKLPQLSSADSLSSWNIQAPDTAASGLSNSLSIGGPSTELSGINPDFAPGAKTPGIPDMGGKWMDGANIGLGFAKVGLDVYNALEQSKMNKFMKGYYGDMMDMQKSTFENEAKITNASIAQREQNKQSAAGNAFGTAASDAAVAATLDKWGVKGTF